MIAKMGPIAPVINGKFMVNRMILRGGSCPTPADHNFFG